MLDNVSSALGIGLDFFFQLADAPSACFGAGKDNTT